jgi:uncharacterized protein YfaS (alpha-2-macroglobulin family)
MKNNPITHAVKLMMSMLKSILGDFSWRCPPWFAYLEHKKETKPGFFWAGLSGIIIVLALSAYGYQYYSKLPKPVLVTAQITPPRITPNSEELVSDPLVINFGTQANGFVAKSIAPLSNLNKELNSGVSLSPAIAGKWKWETDSQLVFTPAQDWPAGQTYQLHFDKTLFSTTANMKQFDYEFKTENFRAQLVNFKLYQDPVDAKQREAVATISFNFPVDTGSFEKNLQLTEETVDKQRKQSGVNYTFTVTYDKWKREAYVHSQALPITDTEHYIDLQLAKGVKSSTHSSATENSLTDSLLIPNADHYFKVASVKATIVRNTHDRPEQIVTIETTLGATQSELQNNLTVMLLPQDYPATANENAKPNYAWQNPGEISPAILALSTRVALTAIPTEQSFSTLHSFKINAPSTRYVYIQLKKGMHSFGDFALADTVNSVVAVPAYPKEISFLHKGALMALASEKKLSVIVRGIPAVKFTIARVLPDNLNHLVTQTQGDFNNPQFLNPSFNQDNISQLFSEIQDFDQDAAADQYTALDLTKYLQAKENIAGPQGLFLLTAQAWDKQQDTGLDVKSSRLILVTDLGMISKDNANGSHDVYLQSISTGKPAANVVVSVLGKNGLAIATQTTNADGHVTFASLNDYSEDQAPTVYLAQLGSDVAFMPYAPADRQLNMSKFDVGGVHTVNNEGDTQNLSAYVFSDRGIYRPGDTAHFGVIVKGTNLTAQPAGLPLELTIIDSRGTTVKEQKVKLDDSGYFSLDFLTKDQFATGDYTLNVFIVKDNHASNLLGSNTFRVAEFLPDTMRITAALSSETKQGWVSPENLTASVNLWNLYGAPASDRKISAKLLLTPQAFTFKTYPNYVFVDPLIDAKKPAKVFTDTLTDGKSNDKGEATFNLNLTRFAKATYHLTFFAEGFAAEGGRSVAAQANVMVSPLTFLIGYKPNGSLNYIKQNADSTIQLIAINPQLKQQAADDLKLQLLSLHPVSTLVKKADGTYQYQSVMQTTVIKSESYRIADTGNTYSLPTETIGDFSLVILDKNNTALSKVDFSVVGASQAPLPKNAELTLKLSKTEFAADSDIDLQITAPYVGAGLITLERDKVYAQKWFKTDSTSSVQTIHIPKEFEGNGYVNIAFVRDWNSPDIFISPLSYSIEPFAVDHSQHALRGDLHAPANAKPGEKLTLHYQTDKPAKIIVFAVDEGILLAGHYQTPNPLQFFFQKKALEVTTQQILDQILPNFMQDREVSSVGGDANKEASLTTLNPFKRKTDLPMVYWSGLIDSNGSDQTLEYTVPDYFNGSLRIMAVAVDADQAGANSIQTEVKGDFVITPNAPTFVAPGDEFDLSASIANNVEHSGLDAPVTISLASTGGLEVVNTAEQTITIPEGKEKSVHFRLRAIAKLGSADMILSAKSGGKRATLATSLSVRPASTFRTTIANGYSTKQMLSLPLDRQLYSAYRSVDAILSSSPLVLVANLNRFLDNYPFGCTEQLTSKALPLLALANQAWFNPDKAAVTTKIEAAIQTLGQRQMSDGSFSYWPNMSANENNVFATVYAMHFLTEAKDQGYPVPVELFRNSLGYLKTLAAKTPTNLDDARTQAMAIYLLTRNEIVTTNYLTHLQAYLDKDTQHAWHQDIISAYIASTYQLLKSDSEANRFIAFYTPHANVPSESNFYNEHIADAQYLYLISRHFPEKMAGLTDSLVIPLVTSLNNEEMTTVLAGYASSALSAFSEHNSATNKANLSIDATLQNGSQQTLSQSAEPFQQAALEASIKSVDFANPSQLGFFYGLTQAGFDSKPDNRVIHDGIEVTREFRDANHQVISSVKLGDEVEVHVLMRALGDDYLRNIAIVDLLPGGFEVVNQSLRANDYDYADVREDRVVFFAGVGSEAHEIVYKIKAISTGHYVVPGIFANLMYNPHINALGVSSSITVTNGD